MAKKLYAFRHPNAKRVQTQITETSMTQSEFAKESDINYIVDRHIKAGIPFPVAPENFADVSDVPEFQAAQNALIKANQAWYSLDAKIRRHFGDNIENFLGALSDPDQHEDLIRLKVLAKKEEQTSQVPKKDAGSSAPKSGEAPPKAEGAKAPGTVST